jgi:hypothetical protein
LNLKRGRRRVKQWVKRDSGASYAGFWVTRKSGNVVCRHLDDLDAVDESDTCDELRQLICSFVGCSSPSVSSGVNLS